ncbi:hypothetical protein KGF56_004860 [Candida oxycetoniae]|uniref:Cell wall mannoprotein PIR1-like C-terminal domain-containing protein n=1 Tax=Candida oxycetoniae TaxID=497107 RepID=A0AAI9SRV9_9ASCO|nr:uncharacterized protein KGF56_004860 [Candida oxycetoniae]KAI3402290.1 hypothetical protein KGF56_004860 [Candida oxycetoniae]
MKFTSALAAFGLLAVAQSNLIKRGGDYDDYTPWKPYYPKVFTLGVKVDGKIYYSFQVNDGQFEFDHKEYEEYCEPPHKPKWKSEPKHDSGKWKRGDDEYDDDDDEEDDNTVQFGDDDDDDKKDKYYKPGYKPYHPFLKVDYYKGLDVYTLKNTILKDSKGRIGSIVANHQFQFDKPTQPDALFTKGFSIVWEDKNWLLALNGKTTFWDSALNDYLYKVYDAPITSKSRKVELVIIEVVFKSYD